jgi:hypothetical protein
MRSAACSGNRRAPQSGGVAAGGGAVGAGSLVHLVDGHHDPVPVFFIP